ncbi:unnamed protein product [Nippostrongylus brasiliensis]|uniref:MFS domain-containing protein n=1 Tax=Nippostrongylus brasiliensis TaxID=27835 RepID=A0A0N4YVE1_NIPBR|nr:unnamed protein product [Nippostrongylus brasiliensis]
MTAQEQLLLFRTIYGHTKKRVKKEVVYYTHFEEVLQKINPFGAYQIFTIIVILYASIEWAGNSTFMDVLGSLEPDWNCTLKNSSYVTDHKLFLSTVQIVNNSFYRLNSVCLDFIVNLIFKRNSVEFYSLVANFKLICDDSDKVKWIQVIQAGGSLIGSIIGGHLGDHFGRQTIFFTGQLLIIITSMMYRVVLASAFQWPIAYMVIALIAFLTKDWQNFFVFLNLVSSPLTIGFMLFLESPRWLIASGKLDKACEVINHLIPSYSMTTDDLTHRNIADHFRHIGSIVGLIFLTPLLSTWTVGAFVVPECLIVATLIIGLFLQPETKGKALMDQMVQANYGRLENELPRALIRLAAGHKVAQMEARERHRKELEAVQAAKRAGKEVDSPWAFKEASLNNPSGAVMQVDNVEYHGDTVEYEKRQLNQYSNDAFDRDESSADEGDLGNQAHMSY